MKSFTLGLLALICITSCGPSVPKTVAVDQKKEISDLLIQLEAMPADKRPRTVATSQFDRRVATFGTQEQKDKLAQIMGGPDAAPANK